MRLSIVEPHSNGNTDSELSSGYPKRDVKSPPTFSVLPKINGRRARACG